MKKVAAFLALSLPLAACSSSVTNDFVVRDGNCYRVRVEDPAIGPTRTETVLALPQNCGL